ncbi:MAG: DinB family protein [Caldilineaceae bacterium]
MANEQSAINLLRAQFTQCFEWLEGTMAGVTMEVANYKPAGNVSPIAGQLAHTITSLDGLVVGAVAGKAPVMASSFAGKTGMSEAPPPGFAWGEWGQRVQLDLPAFHEYSKAVFTAVHECLDTLSDGDLTRELDLPFGKQTVSWVFNIMLLNTLSHTGEIACLKGLQGLKGYPA